MKTFAQGIHPEYHKEGTQAKAIKELNPPRKVIIPLHQHTGASCEPLVKAGDEVFEGQKIGDTSKFISAPVHASISGKVTGIDKMSHPCGVNVLSVVIESQTIQGPKSEATDFGHRTLDNLTPEDIRKIVREAGIVGLGGAAFPTHVKLVPPPGKSIDTILINGCECEPYLTADHRIMLEHTEDVIYGAKAIARACAAKRIVIGIEDNKPAAIERLKSVIRRQKDYPTQEVTLKTKYPQGGEKMLVKAILNREVPSGGLPLDVGVVVSNVGTAVAVAQAVRHGTPLIKRVVTVAGSGVKNPQNILVRIGTTFAEVIEQCGGLAEDAAKVVMGGPMMGVSQSTLEVPVVKATSGILVLKRWEADAARVYPCVKCGRCVDHCPMFLVPSRLAAFSENGKYSEFEEWGGQDCIECGSCAYVCPARIPIVHWIKLAKLKLVEMK
jgi:electron transport complex protein RnfC